MVQCSTIHMNSLHSKLPFILNLYPNVIKLLLRTVKKLNLSSNKFTAKEDIISLIFCLGQTELRMNINGQIILIKVVHLFRVSVLQQELQHFCKP